MDPNLVVELEGRHNAGFGVHIRWKILRINSEKRWGAYKEVVAESLDKALEIFATKKVDSALPLDLHRFHSPLTHDRSPPPMNQDEIIEEIPLTQRNEIQPSEEENDDHEVDNDDHEENEIEIHDNYIGDLDIYNAQENMDVEIPYSRCYASDSDDEGPDVEVDEEGFTQEEA